MTHYQNQNFCFSKNKYKLWNPRSRFVKPSICLWDQANMYPKQVYSSMNFLDSLSVSIKIKQPFRLLNQIDKNFRKLCIVSFDVTNKRDRILISQSKIHQFFEQVQQQKVLSIRKIITMEQNGSQTLFNNKFQNMWAGGGGQSPSPPPHNFVVGNVLNRSFKSLKLIKNCIISTNNSIKIKQPLLIFNNFSARIDSPREASVIPDSKLIISNIKVWVNSSTWKNIQARPVYSCHRLSFLQWCKVANKHLYRHYLRVYKNFFYYACSFYKSYKYKAADVHKLRICLAIFLQYSLYTSTFLKNVFQDKSLKIKFYNLINARFLKKEPFLKAENYLIKNLIKKNKNLPHSMLVIYLNMFLNFAQFFFKILIHYFFAALPKKSINIGLYRCAIKNFIIELLTIKKKKFLFFCMIRVCPMRKHNLKNQNNIRFLKKELAGKRYCHWISPNLCLSLSLFSEEIDVVKEKIRPCPINTKKNNHILQVYPCIWAYGLFFEHIKKTMLHCFFLMKIQHNLLVSQLLKINSYAKLNYYHVRPHFCLKKSCGHWIINKSCGHWIINKSNLIFRDFSVVNKKDLLFAVPRQIKSSKKFLFLANLNLEKPLILTKIIPILWQASKKNQSQNTLYLIWKKYWLKLKTYYFYIKKRLKKNKNTNTNTKLLFWKALKKKSNITLFFKNIFKIKYNMNGQIQFLSFVLQLSYEQSLTINKFAIKQQDQSLSLTEFVEPFLTKKKNFYNKFKKVKNIQKTLKVFIKKNNKVIQNQIYLYTYYFNTYF
jgi:hypothetical protein